MIEDLHLNLNLNPLNIRIGADPLSSRPKLPISYLCLILNYTVLRSLLLFVCKCARTAVNVDAKRRADSRVNRLSKLPKMTFKRADTEKQRNIGLISDKWRFVFRLSIESIGPIRRGSIVNSIPTVCSKNNLLTAFY